MKARKKIPTYAIAIDTETTGTYLYHGCQPFMVTACDTEGNLFCWEYEVDILTREVLYSKSPEVTKNIYATLSKYPIWVFHNATFDLRALEIIFQDSFQELSKDKVIEDTLIQSHIMDSADSHGLKYLAALHLNVPWDDQDALKQAVTEARRIAKRLLLGIADEYVDSLPNQTGEYTYCDYWLPKALAKKEQYPSDHLWHTVCQQYAERDVERTIVLYNKFTKYLRNTKVEKTVQVNNNGNTEELRLYKNLLEIYNDHRRIIKPVLNIQANGIRFYYNKAIKAIQSLTEELIPFQEVISDVAGEDFNYRSTKQLRELLYDYYKFPVLFKTGKGDPSTDAGTLETLASNYRQSGIEIVDSILEIRKRETTMRYINNYLSFATAYVTKYTDGSTHTLHYLHPSLNATGTSTTRFSSSNPNGQNISKGEDVVDDSGKKKKVFNLRELFGPPPGYVWYTIDYKSLQLIIFAYESGDDGLITTFLSGGDPHHYVACGLFNTNTPTELQRRIAKNVNYGLIFGAGESKIDATAGRKGTFKLYNDQFPGVNRYMQSVIKEARRKGYVTTAWGYPLVVSLDFAYKGVNYIIQGDEGEIVKRAMIYCNEYLTESHPECQLIMQIHDELIFQCPSWYDFPLAEIKQLMMKPASDIGWSTPVDASIVKVHWGSKESV